MPTWYVYSYKERSPTRPRYLGFVKGKPREALREAQRRWPGRQLDLINKKFVADKHARTIAIQEKEE